MALSRQYCFLIFSLLNVIFTASGETTYKHSDVEERVLKFTMRTFSNSHGKWFTQMHLEREGFPEKGETPRVRFSVEQSKSGYSRPPRLLAHLSESFHTDNEYVIMENERFEMLTYPHVSWLAGKIFCRQWHKTLALPSDAATKWFQTASYERLESENENLSFFVGISNIYGDDTLETIHGQTVMNGSEILESDDVACGVWNASDPFTLTFGDCLEKRAILCEAPQKWVSKTFDVSKWLESKKENN